MLSELKSSWIGYIFDNMGEAICLTGMNGELLYTNPAARELFGLSEGHAGKIWEAIPYVEGNDELIQLFIDGVMEKKKSLRDIVDYVNPEGKVFRLHVSLTCETDDEGRILIVISDLTLLKKFHTVFSRYTSPEIAKYVMFTPDGEKQGGQERDVSILMSDLRGFTVMSTGLSSGELITVLNNYFESMNAVIRCYRGTVIEFLGDGIFVVFGAPEDQPNHPEDAVSCAVEMQNAMAAVNAWNREHGYPELAMGIGVTSGKATVGNIGSADKMKYGCMGEIVNLAGRLESFCVGGQIYVSEETRNRLEDRLTVIGEHSFMPKGGRKEMTIYRISGVGGVRLADNAGEDVDWKANDAAPVITWYSLEGKTVEETGHRGRILKISGDGKYGILETAESLKPMQDLLLRAGDTEAYAKVLRQDKDGYRIGFTAAPKGLAALIG